MMLATVLALLACAGPSSAQRYLPQPNGPVDAAAVPQGPPLTRIYQEHAVPVGGHYQDSRSYVAPPRLQRLESSVSSVPSGYAAAPPGAVPAGRLPAPPLPGEPSAPAGDRRMPYLMQQSMQRAPSAKAAPATQNPRSAPPPARPATPAAAPTFAPVERPSSALTAQRPAGVATATVATPRRSQGLSAMAPPPDFNPQQARAPSREPNVVTQRLPAAALADRGEFVIGVADMLSVTVVGEPDLSQEVDVATSGDVNLPLVGAVAVQGLTAAAAAERIAAAYAEGDYLVSPQVQVRVLESRNLMISVLGEVRQPGRFAAPTQMSVLDALALAGGIAETGDQRVTVLRSDAQGGMQRREIDLTSLLAGNETQGAEHLMLLPGDTVLVPEAALFYIYGEVRSPNAYPLKPGMTVMQALALGGGANERGSRKRIEVQRQQPDGRVITQSVSLADVVQPDDVIYIRERLF